MNLLYVVLPSAVVLLVAYFVYGRILTRLFHLDPNRKTPAHELRDDIDYQPVAPSTLFPQHFSAIAAAGPIVGPILAGVTFGWLPALLWILIGGILIGGVHDFAALVASIRHKARSIAEVVRDHMTPFSYILFLSFIWIALVYIIVAFTDVTASSFVIKATKETGDVGGGAIATSSMLYLALPIAMGLLVRFARMPLWLATLIFVPLVGVAIWVGKYIPFDVAAMIGNDFTARKVWDVALLIYCLVAGVLPVWLLLQPRGHLGGYFLYAALGAGAIGLVFGGATIKYDDFIGWNVPNNSGIDTVFPAVFIMVACGACSGFHSLIASGTTAKQLRRETDARPVAYGSMLLESMVAVVSLCCVMMFAVGAPEVKLSPGHGANMVYAQGIGKFLEVLHVSKAFGMSFALMAFTTFVYDTLDVCTRLGRFIIQELTGLHGRAGRWLGTTLTAGVPLFFLLRHNDPNVEVYKVFWNLFGASNQLLAALTLLGITVWLWKTRRAWWVWVVTGIPTAWMYVMSTWGLLALTVPKFYVNGSVTLPTDVVPWVGLVLIVLAVLMLVEAIRVFASLGGPTQPRPEEAVPAGAVGAT